MAADADVDRNLVYMARAVVQYAPGLAAAVMSGASLRAAYERALQVKRDQDENVIPWIDAAGMWRCECADCVAAHGEQAAELLQGEPPAEVC